jgi:hypothetical protein
MGIVGLGDTGRHSAAVLDDSGWSARLYDGLSAQRIAPETRDALARALGAVGVEAEFLLVLVDAFPGAARPDHHLGELFLQRLASALLRLTDAAAALEVATQGYLAALESAYPGVSATARDEVWWPPFSGYTLRGEPLEARLRRCGFAWRHVVESRLPTHMEAILEQLALTIYALCCLPPAGVMPIWTLYNGLYELSSALHGDLIPRHVLGASGDPRYPGALASVTRLRALDASGDTSLASDLAWAQAQYAAVGGGQTGDARILAAHAAYQWGRTIGFLEYLRRQTTRPA